MKKFANESDDFGYSASKAIKPVPRCFESHPALSIGEYKVYGGSCMRPAVKDADIYVGLDYGMEKDASLYPWNGSTGVLFVIQDMSTPDNTDEFKKMVSWLSAQIKAGKKVHIGCLGGHGRTGLVLSALVKEMTGEENAIQYVRDHYCEKAVESEKQINYLHKHFGISKVKPSKSTLPALPPLNNSLPWTESEGGFWSGDWITGTKSKPKAKVVSNVERVNDLAPKELIDVHPLFIHGSIWGEEIDYPSGL